MKLWLMLFPGPGAGSATGGIGDRVRRSSPSISIHQEEDMDDHDTTLHHRVAELAARKWDEERIRENFRRLTQKGISEKKLDGDKLLADRETILDQVQRSAEEYEYLSHSCAKSSALAVMELFGLGGMDVIRAMSPFPGFGMTGGICGAVTGGLIALGLFFGGDDMEDYEATGRTMTAARSFIPRFKTELGSIFCPEIQEKAIFGRYLDPRASQENFEAFKQAQGYEKCALPAGIGARIAAELIIDSFK
jgi:C_GCAxxG_C_C family probable redox protein